MISTALRLLAVLFLLAFAATARAAWYESKSKHFLIYSQQNPAQLAKFAEKLERVDQAMREALRLADPPVSEGNRLSVFVVRKQEDIAKLAGSSSVYGFYIPRASGSVAFVPASYDTNRTRGLTPDAVFFHEYSHHLQLQNTKNAMPRWVTEGFAEFFSTAEVRNDGSVVIGKAVTHRALSLQYLDDLTMTEMVGNTLKKMTGAQNELIYARGWLLTHYLTFEASRKGQLNAYLAAIAKGTPPLDAAKDAFGDLTRLGVEVESYRRRNRVPFVIIEAQRLSPSQPVIRQLQPGEAAVMDVRIISARGVDKKTAPGVAADARAAAAPYPNDPTAQVVLAEAELDAKNYVAAEAAVDRALAANPQHLKGLVYKGRIRMALAEKDPAKANWADIRNWFAKANRVDPDAAEPLMLFYETYDKSGKPPTANAIEGLLYALDAAPQDRSLRIMALRQMLKDGKLAQARAIYAPFAFDPHAGAKWRETSEKIGSALAAGDTRSALATLDAAIAEQKKEQEKEG